MSNLNAAFGIRIPQSGVWGTLSTSLCSPCTFLPFSGYRFSGFSGNILPCLLFQAWVSGFRFSVFGVRLLSSFSRAAISNQLLLSFYHSVFSFYPTLLPFFFLLRSPPHFFCLLSCPLSASPFFASPFCLIVLSSSLLPPPHLYTFPLVLVVAPLPLPLLPACFVPQSRSRDALDERCQVLISGAHRSQSGLADFVPSKPECPFTHLPISRDTAKSVAVLACRLFSNVQPSASARPSGVVVVVPQFCNVSRSLLSKALGAIPQLTEAATTGFSNYAVQQPRFSN